MRALHVFPLFGSEPTNGSERHFFMLSKALAARGVQVDVLATRSQTLRSVAAFALRWTTDYGGDVETADGVTIRRFRATPVLPRSARCRASSSTAGGARRRSRAASCRDRIAWWMPTIDAPCSGPGSTTS